MVSTIVWLNLSCSPVYQVWTGISSTCWGLFVNFHVNCYYLKAPINANSARSILESVNLLCNGPNNRWVLLQLHKEFWREDVLYTYKKWIDLMERYLEFSPWWYFCLWYFYQKSVSLFCKQRPVCLRPQGSKGHQTSRWRRGTIHSSRDRSGWASDRGQCSSQTVSRDWWIGSPLWGK